jgi:hypothetical protein
VDATGVSAHPGVRSIAYAFRKVAALLALAAVSSAAEASGSAAAGGAPAFLTIPQIVVPIVGSDRIDGVFKVKLVLAAKDAASLAQLTKRLPELRAVSVAEAIEFSRLFASPQLPVDARRLSANLTAALHTADPGIARVLIVEVSAES